MTPLAARPRLGRVSASPLRTATARTAKGDANASPLFSVALFAQLLCSVGHLHDWWDPNHELPYKAIPADYAVCFAAVFQAAPHGQVATIPKKFQFDFTIDDRHVTAVEAKQYFGAPAQIEGWETPTIYSKESPVPTWTIGWLCPVTVEPGTTHSGTMSYAQTAPMIDLIWWGPHDPDDPDYTPPRPSRYTPYASSASYSFTVGR
jgi:hypothetical protein